MTDYRLYPEYKRKSNKINVLPIIFTLAIAFAIGYVVFTFIVNKDDDPNTPTPTPTDPILTEPQKAEAFQLLEKYPWWNTDYSSLRQITLQAPGTSVIEKSQWVDIDLNHSELVSSRKSLENGRDLTVLYYDGSDYLQLTTYVKGLNTASASLYFEVQSQVSANNSNENYFLYYGNPLAKNSLLGPPAALDLATGYESKLGNEIHPLVYGYTNRLWVLKDAEGLPDYSTLTYTVETVEPVEEGTEIQYEIEGSSVSGTLGRYNANYFSSDLDTSSLNPGAYLLTSTVLTDQGELKSQRTPIYISYPIFVAMTVDWEGYDVPDEEYTNMDAFSSRHNDLNFTHFYNPRVYIANDIDANRVTKMTTWIKQRQSAGDGVALHLHMYTDMVASAGITPKTTPVWGGSYSGGPEVAGRDVPTTAYNYSEFKTILEWSVDQFEAQGLGTPIGFRGGGWFINTELMRALQDAGFKYDSSGRTLYYLGAYRLSPGWDLTPTTKPYQPSMSDMNSSAGGDLLDLWEFPDNGGDSVFHETDEMLDRFKSNYSGGVAESMQTVTYLTHPHTIHKDFIKLDPVFDEIDNYLVKNDEGPVVYISLDKAYSETVN